VISWPKPVAGGDDIGLRQATDEKKETMTTIPNGDGAIPATPIYDETIASLEYPDLIDAPPGEPQGNDEGSDAGAAADEAKDRVKQAAGTAKDQAANVASGAKDAGARVASTTKEQASRVATDALSQAKDLYGQAASQLSEQAGEQQQRAASTLGTIADDLADMREQHDGGGLASELVEMLGQRAGQVSEWLEDKSPEEVLHEVQQLAARRPWLFIALAAGTGIVAARLTKALVADAKSDAPTGGVR
jgi:hypothetical protein